MDKKTLLKTVVDALEDVKGQNIRVYDTTKKTSAFDHVVIASGTSNRQTRALASAVSKAVKATGGKVSGIEGTDTGEWVLVDCGSVVCHCMQPAIRQYYDLEELWGPDALDVKALFAKAEQNEQQSKPARKRAPRSTAKKTTATKTAKTSTKTAETVEKKVTAKKTAAKKTPAKKEAAAKKTTVKKAVASSAKKPVSTAKKRTTKATASTAKKSAKVS
ncbi:MAG: ribosome silencing factor [Sutterella sp.]|nr:ribosome silencing factor [Sutterella sp.]